MKLGETLRRKRHDDFEAFDRIELVLTPRYKTSGTSGDEWRVSVEVTFSFKGEVVHACGYHNMQSALMHLPSAWLAAQCPIPDRVIELEQHKCDQPSCATDAVSIFRLKEKFSAQGEKLDQSDGLSSWEERRQFCQKHLRRGDCGREDADDNYEIVSGPGPSQSSNSEESPSAFGGIVEIS